MRIPLLLVLQCTLQPRTAKILIQRDEEPGKMSPVKMLEAVESQRAKSHKLEQTVSIWKKTTQD